MNIVILGPGAVGSLWASKFQSAGHGVSLWSTSLANELHLALDQQAIQTYSNRNIELVRQADLILVTVKAWQVDQAITPLLSYLNQEAIIVLLHNGMGTAQSVARQLPDNPLVLATTTHGAYKPNKSQVQHTGHGQTQLGGYNPRGKQCTFLGGVFDHALSPSSWHEAIEDALWIKLAINCAINPMTAIHQVKNGQLASESYQAEIDVLVAEVHQVLVAQQVTISYQTLRDTVNHVIETTANNHSSMQQDIFHRRPSEIDFITGYLLERAEHYRIPVPKNLELYQSIKRIEQSWNSQ